MEGWGRGGGERKGFGVAFHWARGDRPRYSAVSLDERWRAECERAQWCFARVTMDDARDSRCEIAVAITISGLATRPAY
jgi:hypothetical protein